MPRVFIIFIFIGVTRVLKTEGDEQTKRHDEANR
jgi:hypothetical protein